MWRQGFDEDEELMDPCGFVFGGMGGGGSGGGGGQQRGAAWEGLIGN